jgi:multidrug transporter EmrE-like cation transporter
MEARMPNARSWIQPLTGLHDTTGITLALLLGNLLFNILANAAFKVSAFSPNWRGFLLWQVLGTLAGFITVLTLTGLLRYVPLHTAFTVTTGLAVIGVQVAAAAWLFREPISRTDWIGALLIVAGIALVGRH